ncbi:DUF7507 domain-containing protein [Actinocrispum wychmicini]|uniref:Putative repeat protein (TIGR01451 family) n=1 Tax=Actinocrispum wychmicini TaxID=1213861 RepID=A0A4R2K4Q9_9PSEU|nr:DUF3344 domain-containing protein [Actinocrispum wychmicini]TCO64806.1 putative repeat protein (TIGR01451 family) [Actinocrispum wychmicini]
MRLVLVGLVLLAGLTGAARADAAEPFEQAYNRIVNGDFLSVGNGSLRCPVAADNAPTTSEGNTPGACADAAMRANKRVNDNFFMQWADVDDDPGTFDSSSATVDLPANAKVEFARLHWGGNTGLFADSTVPMCQSRGSETPAVLPAGAPNKQKVRLVTKSKTVDVAPRQVMVDPPGTFRGAGQFYSAYADVTDAIAAGPVVVGNVWAPKGFGCIGGWSLTVVYSVPGGKKRQVLVYDGHVRQSNGDPKTVAHIDGFRAATTEAHVGITAYEGDWGIGGDQFDGSPGDNFFVSQADGRLKPDAPNNFSVDVRSVTMPVTLGASSVDLGFVTTGDGFMVQSLAFSVAVPALQVTQTVDKPAVHPGDTVTFTITVTNTGGTPVTDIQAGCQSIPSLESGQSHSHTCTVTAPADDFANVVKVTGKTPIGDVEGSAETPVEVLNPAVGITKTADKAAYRDGDTVTFTVTVSNTGDTPLQGVEVVDEKTPACGRKLAAPGTFTCTAVAPVAGNVNTARVSGADRLGKQVTASADASVKMIHPGLALTKTVDRAVVRQGDTVTFTIDVRNSGDAPLTGVVVQDDIPSCAKEIGDLSSGQEIRYACSVVAEARGASSVSTATGVDETQRTVTGGGSAGFTVIHPGISVVVSVGGPYRPGDVVTFTVSVRNTGDVPLTDVVVTDPIAPDCARALTALADYQCTMAAPADDLTNLVTVSAKPPVGPPVAAADGAFVDVVLP